MVRGGSRCWSRLQRRRWWPARGLELTGPNGLLKLFTERARDGASLLRWAADHIEQRGLGIEGAPEHDPSAVQRRYERRDRGLWSDGHYLLGGTAGGGQVRPGRVPRPAGLEGSKDVDQLLGVLVCSLRHQSTEAERKAILSAEAFFLASSG